ncbi:hypothetical protein F5Y13DRAFT_112812 [Hypoxylon sp. FL1857]|nr:hypothetical protein F5Y13DRAFT_112812 [Hypoxylon sp. FL1857]
MSLRHIAIPSWTIGNLQRYPSYALATRVQSKLQEDLLAWRDLPVNPHGHKHEHDYEHGRPGPPPPPALLSFTPAPTYTLGRRQTEPLPPEELARLRAPLGIYRLKTRDGSRTWSVFKPEVVHTPRGGLTTYHGPGQLVLWPVIDLRSPLHQRFTVRDYVRLLEETTIATLQGLYDIEGFTTEDPGVWVRRNTGEKKIAALGVHLRRYVTGLGVAINIKPPSTNEEHIDPWARIVPCGIENKGVTTVVAKPNKHVHDLKMTKDISSTWAIEFASRLGVGNSVYGGPLVWRDDWELWEKKLERELEIDQESEDQESEDYVTSYVQCIPSRR